PGVLKVWGIDNDNTELWKHRGFGTSWLPGGDGFLGECNQRYWLLLRKEAQGFFLGTNCQIKRNFLPKKTSLGL
ncbi:hypothetical protein ACG1P5_16785, partial [Lactiplantibacillus plantarum]|uniref:hypothetical protein n=1 Tax=Lactiplantibacillus plantarum TaxID=1590 RepID=UPI00374CDC4A